jgi:hypothetical protein
MLKGRWGECRFFVCQRSIMMRKNNISNYFLPASLGSINFFYKEKLPATICCGSLLSDITLIYILVSTACTACTA